MSLNKSKLSGLVNVFTMVLQLVRWWWWCCCCFLPLTIIVPSVIVPPVVVIVPALHHPQRLISYYFAGEKSLRTKILVTTPQPFN
jgi:hypothetical protein